MSLAPDHEAPAPMPIFLGERTFLERDQQAFAAVSHDVNPMHVDAIAARRLLSGRMVVHGVHTLLQALDWWRPRAGARPTAVRCGFDQAISVGDRVLFEQVDDGPDSSVVTASVDGRVCTQVSISCAAAAGEVAAGAAAPAADAVVRLLGGLNVPLDEVPGSQQGQTLVLPPWGDALAESFPHAAQVLSPQALGALARLSYFVGMVCPGQHSVFSSLQFDFSPGATVDGALAFTLKRYDPRLKLFMVSYSGALRGELRAFLRPAPQPQPSTHALMAQVRPQEFKGTRTLVIGGSRGLGEMTAKLLAAGGGEVIVSYAQGRDDALRVAADIGAAGAGSCDVIGLDLGGGDVFQTLALDGELDAVYFFATPKIFRKKADLFDAALFGEFTRFYLERFSQLCRWLESRPGSRPVQVYLPSTVFITERPKGMTEYAMAKAAAEVLADDLNRALRRVKVVHSRLPRLATDQTTSILGLSLESNVDTLLPVIRGVAASFRPA